MKRTAIEIGLFSALSCMAVNDARADDEATSRCVEAHHASQTDRRNGQLVRARAELVTCAQDVCPALIASDCKRWLPEVDGSIPTVTIGVSNPAEVAPGTLTITIDHQRIDPALIGRTIEVDPGQHVVHAEAGSFIGDASVVAIAGAHDAVASITLYDRGQHRDPFVRAKEHRSLVPFVVGGIGIVGLGVASGFGIAGLSERAHLENEGCAPHCNHDDVASVQRSFAVADIALGISIVAIATAVVLYVVDTPAEPVQGRAPFTFRF